MSPTFDANRLSGQCLAAILEGALDAIVLIDAGGLITHFNAAAERTFGYARSEAVGRELAVLLIEPGLREAHRRGLQRYLATGESRILDQRIEVRAQRADGTLFDAELTVIRLPEGCAAHFAGFVRDISDRKRAARELARDAEFRERFIGILGHDLRTPLGVVDLTARSLIERGDVDHAGIRSLRRIVRSAERMERMIHDLLDFARIRQGAGIPVTREPADLAVICRHVVEEIELTHEGRIVQLRPRGRVDGEWDSDRMTQVIQNLVVNALDYSPPGTPVEVAIDDAGERVVVAVKNEGPPIPPETMAQIFNPYRRGEQAVASRGLGLGLYIAHEIVRAHEGRLDVESDEARGTTFFVELPRRVARAA